MTTTEWMKEIARAEEAYARSPCENGVARDARRQELSRLREGLAEAAAQEGIMADAAASSYWRSYWQERSSQQGKPFFWNRGD